MPKRIQVLEKDTIYHIFNRWFEKRIIFNHDKDYERFIKAMKRYNDVFDGIKIYSYCLLPNHFHIIMSSSQNGSDISDFMRKLQQSYALYFKTSSKVDNLSRWQFFEWRFKAKRIKDEKYLAQCIAYVNYNPLKHGIVDNIDNYKWTSYHQIDKKKIEKYSDMILDELEI